MKSFFTLVASIAAVSVFAASSFAQISVFNQPIVIPATGDIGSYSARTKSLPDNESAISFDNFSLPGTAADTYDINGIAFDGVYSEAIPTTPGETDFLVEIWAHNTSAPDLGAGPLFSYNLSAGLAGVSDDDVATTSLGHNSPTTLSTPGGGPAYHYEASFPSTASLSGDTLYWLSIQALQTFPNAPPVFDPQWQWHLGTGAGDGFYAQDSFLDPAGTPAYGTLQFGKDLAFELKAVPEPAANLILLGGVFGLALVRRRR